MKLSIFIAAGRNLAISSLKLFLMKFRHFFRLLYKDVNRVKSPFSSIIIWSSKNFCVKLVDKHEGQGVGIRLLVEAGHRVAQPHRLCTISGEKIIFWNWLRNIRTQCRSALLMCIPVQRWCHRWGRWMSPTTQESCEGLPLWLGCWMLEGAPGCWRFGHGWN